MKRFLICLTAVCLLLSGCSSWMDGSHVTVQDHQEQFYGGQNASLAAEDYEQLVDVLEQLVEFGLENGVISVAQYDPEELERGVLLASVYVRMRYPLGAYAVEDITYEIGSSGGQPAVSVNISYIHGRSEIRQIQKAADMEDARTKIREALEACSEGIVLLIDEYEETDLVQMVADYATEHPEIVMEMPQVAVGVYPESGESRVTEVKFTYQTSRDVLRQMQSQVQRVFTSAAYYIDSDSDDVQKYTQLYGFLMERFDNAVETSITPSYSLLIHGVGDSKALATAYASMCRQAELECQIVSGTREGESRYWNLIRVDGGYYHVDLLKCDETGVFEFLTDEQMQGYVWDYSAYPAL